MVLTFILVLDLCFQILFRGQSKGVMNAGISFGLLPGLGSWVGVGVFLALVIWFLVSSKTNKNQLWLLALLFGGLGNLLPRLVLGSVWDYLYFPVLAFWFNLSDVLITGGVISYILGGDGNPNFI